MKIQWKILAMISLLMCLFTSSSWAENLPKQALYAIISAVPQEAEYIRQHIENPKTVTRGGLKFVLGTINHRQVVSIISGFGKITESAVTSRLLLLFHPTAVILAETSGAVNKSLPIGAVVIGDQIFDADFGYLTAKGPVLPLSIKNPVNNEDERLIFASDKHLLSVAKKTLQQVHFDFPVSIGKLADGDMLPNPEWELNLLRKSNVQAISMDGIALAKIGWLFNTPFLVIHSVSNIAGEDLTDKGLTIAGNNGGKLTVAIVSRL